MDTQLLSQNLGKVRNPFHYLAEPICPEYSQIPCTKQRKFSGYISPVHPQHRNTYRTPPETGRLSELYSNCLCNTGAQYEQSDITLPQKQPPQSFFQQSFQSPPPTSKAAQTIKPFMPKPTSSPLPSFIYLSPYNTAVDSVSCIKAFPVEDLHTDEITDHNSITFIFTLEFDSSPLHTNSEIFNSVS